MRDDAITQLLEREAVPAIDDLLEEVSQKNHVRVQVFRSEKAPGSRTILRRTLDEMADTVTVHGPALYIADTLRSLKGLKPIYVAEWMRRLGGEWVGATENLRTNVGIDFTATQLGSTAPTTQADYIALTNNTAAPAAGDTSASVAAWSSAQSTDAAASGTTGEWTALGLTRKQATYAHTTSATSYTMSATWTATGTATGTQKAGLFGGSSRTAQGTSANNILFLENTFTATTLNTSDQLSLTWTVNI